MARKPKNKLGRGGYPQRRVEQRDPRPRFLIVCEGRKTEPSYFRQFPVAKEFVDLEVIGYGQQPLNVVQYAIDRMEADGSHNSYDQIWAVFDRDDVPKQDFNEARELAKRKKIGVAYSNEAFELWYLLHFDYLDTALSRTQYEDMLSKRLRREDPACLKYEKKDPRTYERLLNRQEKAIENATRLLAQYDPPRPYDDNPSTTVHLLVQELKEYSRK